MRSPFEIPRWRRSHFIRPSEVAPGTLTASGDGSTISFTDLGSDAFSVTISGSATSAYNGTYTQDADGTALAAGSYNVALRYVTNVTGAITASASKAATVT